MRFVKGFILIKKLIEPFQSPLGLMSLRVYIDKGTELLIEPFQSPLVLMSLKLSLGLYILTTQ